MPATITHAYFAEDLFNILDKNTKKLISNKKKELMMFSQNTDPLMFYILTLKNGKKIRKLQFVAHTEKINLFFENTIKYIKKNKYYNNPDVLVFLYGFICHFALDSTCHGYIDEKIAQSGVSHTEIEVEFDRSLMIEDGKDPVRQDLTKHIVPSMENASVIAPFFQGAEPKQVKKALKGMIQNNHLLLAPSRLKRMLIYAILRLSGNYKEMHGLLVNFEENPACEDSTAKLHQVYAVAKRRAVMLIDAYGKYMAKEEALNTLYNYTFSGKEKEA